jgi:predicted NBD/HSP70 family sugar kinase
MSLYIGLDIGGTKFMAACGDGQGVVENRLRRETPEDLQEGLDCLDGMVEELAGGRAIGGIGAAIGGPLDWESGVVSPLHQKQWRSVPLKEHMRRRWKCAFHVDVDTNVAAVGEYVLTGQTAGRFLYLTMSTGMGGGFLVDGGVYRGAGGAHPEVAHQAIPFVCSHPGNVACECGSGDCLEALVSGNGIRRVYGKRAEELSEAEWGEVAHNLGQGLRNLAAIYAPDVIVIGGGIAHGRGMSLLAPAAEVMRQRLHIVPHPQVRVSRLGYDTALLGALVVARRGL